MQLDGSESFDPEGQLITYTWKVISVPTGSQVTDSVLTDKTSPNATFTADVAGKYVFELVVRDGQLDSAPDQVEITATAANVPPNAEAGANQTALVGTLVTLDGGTSTDPDNGPQPLTYSWAFVQVPAGSTRTNADIGSATQVQASFVPDKVGSYLLRLTVSDGAGSDTDDVEVLASVQNVPPIANAGVDQQVTQGTVVTLDGRGSSDADNGPQPLTFSWRFVSKPTVSQMTDAAINGAATATPQVTPDVVGSYVLELGVFDGANAFDNVMIEVQAPPSTARCPLGHGYWKTHPEKWPVSSLQLGSQSYSKTELLNLLARPSRGDASVILVHQLIAAKLNIAAGVVATPIAATITDADQRLSAFTGKLPYKVKPSTTAGKAMVKAADKLEDFNEGELTPQCKEKDEDHDDGGKKGNDGKRGS